MCVEPVSCGRHCARLQRYVCVGAALEPDDYKTLTFHHLLGKSNELRVERGCRGLENENLVLGHEE